jgi:AraC-like DNA-binding protein
LGKIAGDLQRALLRRAESGAPGRTLGTRIATGESWSVADVVCTSGPADRPFEERHDDVSIAVVVAGSFQYRTPNGHEMMTPGSLFLGNAGECFQCGHEHAAGDRSIAFSYAPDFFERIAADAGAPRGTRSFQTPRLPPLPALSPLASRVTAGAALALDLSWEEMAVALAATAVRVSAGLAPSRGRVTSTAIARVTESVRRIANDPGAPWTLAQLAADAGHSPYHYLRTFRQVTGVTPHQFVLRARLREAALRLLTDDARVIAIAYAAGFGDVSNFNAAFRAEFGVSPREYRARGRG